jgi:ribokinase
VTVIVVGNAAVDTTFEVERLPRPGESVLASAVREDLGGKGLNQAIAAARAGASVVFHAAVGDDAAGAAVEAQLSAERMALTGLVRATGGTDRTTVFVTPDGENAIVTAALQAQAFPPAAARAAVAQAGAGDHVLLQGNLSFEATQACAQAARDRGAKVILNPSPIAFDFSGLWSLADIAVVNEEECVALAPERDLPSAARRLVQRGLGAVVVTRGSRDVLLVDEAGSLAVSVRRLDAVDTTGAGDAFCGTFVAALDSGREVLVAVERGVAAAEIVVTRRGAIASFPTADELSS